MTSMTTNGQRPSAQFAQWLAGFCATAAAGTALPTEKQLASQWRLSVRTVATVLRRDAARGCLVRIPGKGTFVPLPPPAAAVAPARPALQPDLADQLLRSIRRGEIKQGEALPSVKYLCARFHVAPGTVVRAYRALCRCEEVCRVGKTYRVGRFDRQIRESPGDVYLFVNSRADLRRMFLHSARASRAFSKMEDVLSDAGFVVHYDYTANAAAHAGRWDDGVLAPRGVVLHGGTEERVARMPAAFRRILLNRRCRRFPLVVDWHSGRHQIVAEATCVLSHSNSATTVARCLAEHLVAQRWRHATFFMGRYKGQSFGGIFDFLRTRAELKRLDPSFATSIRLVRPGNAVERRLDRTVATNLLSKYTHTPIDSIASAEILPHSSSQDAFESAWRRAERSERRQDGRERAVWVFQHDEIASRALAWARRSGIRVPQDLWLISLHSDPAFYHLGISRCEIDWEAAGYLMAHALIGDFPIEKTTRGYLRLRARMVEKLTTRPCR